MGNREFTTVYELIDYLRMFSPDAPVYIRDTLDHLYDATCDTGEILIDKESNVRSPVIGTCGEPFHEVIDEDVLNK